MVLVASIESAEALVKDKTLPLEAKIKAKIHHPKTKAKAKRSRKRPRGEAVPRGLTSLSLTLRYCLRI